MHDKKGNIMIKHVCYHNVHLQDMLKYENEIWALTICMKVAIKYQFDQSIAF